MVSDVYGQYIPLGLAESGFGAFTEKEIDLPNSFINREATIVHEIEMTMDLPEDDPSATNEESVSVMLVSQPQGAMLRINDDYVIGMWKLVLKAGVAVYLPLVLHEAGMEKCHKFKPPLILVHQKLYLYIQSTNSSSPASCHGRINVTFKKLGQDEWREAFETWAPTG